MTVIFVHPQDPSSPKTWSKIPFFLKKELELADCKIIAVATGPCNLMERVLFKLIQVITKLDYKYNIIFRLIATFKLQYRVSKYKPIAVIHFGTTSALFWKIKNTLNYLVLDNTWNLIISESTNFIKPYPKKNTIEAIDLREKSALGNFDAIFSHTKRVSKNLTEYYNLDPRQVVLIGLGVGNFTPNFQDKNYSERQVIFIARHSFVQKGGELMLESVRIAQKVMPDIKVIIEGGCKVTASTDDIKNLRFTGLSDIDTLERLIKESTLLVMPAIAEPMGIVYIEAMINKTPIVALNRGAIPDFTDDGRLGYICNDEDAYEIADLILNAFNNTEKLKQIAEDGQKFILQNHTWSKISQIIKNQIVLDSSNY